ncbi:cupin domain-containing protein [Deinococcus sp. KNUC1210]|uniref:cupin domain-containing protein n=1 Tax=Deinococcus sp. KNUC1210 TaxID=2917691 RepID=UPI001EF1326A|nr:cupin domain-containing protein [Deinococcus sp. KNUC1210]ULH16506.1 cupin domain-containing protein [Deinococcus sp. KNUC1210]
MNPLQKVTLPEKFAAIPDFWNPRIVGEVGEQYVKLARIQGVFDWHQHAQEDELFFVVRGQLRMGLRDPHERFMLLEEGELLIVPHGTEHRPEAVGEETWIMMIEPKTTLNTGNLKNERTREELERL